MTGYSRTPRVMKGAIVGFDIFNPLASVVVFQYNPATMTRTLAASTSGGQPAGGGRAEPLRLSGAPQEDITFDVEIDTTDQLGEPEPGITNVLGIYPQLSAMEMLLYPKTASVIANTVLAAAGVIEIIAPEAPFTLLIWGPGGVPVQLTSFSIAEEAYDVNLNPIRAKVSLGLRVLSYNDFKPTHPGFGVFLAHQIVKEAMAVVGSVGNVAASVNVAVGG